MSRIHSYNFGAILWVSLFLTPFCSSSNQVDDYDVSGDGGDDSGQNPDTLPTINAFSATSGYGEVALTWTKPSDPNFAGVKILRKTDRFPEGPEDGDPVYDGLESGYTDKGLQNDSYYYYTAFGYNLQQVYARGVTVLAYTLGSKYPQNVSNLVATPGNGQITLTWGNPTDPKFAGVLIKRKNLGYPRNPADGEEAYKGNAASHVDPGLDNETTYFYKLFSYDAQGNYSAGVGIMTSPNDPAAPAPITNFAAAPGEEEILLTWTVPTDPDYDGVTIRRKTSGYPESETDGDPVYEGGGASVIDTGLTNQTIYYYRAFSYDAARDYSSGVSLSASPRGTPPDKVTSLTALASDRQVYLSWLNPVADYAGVTIRRKTTAYPVDHLDGESVLSGAYSNHTNTDLTNGQLYYYGVFAYDADFNYASGTFISATPTDNIAPLNVGSFKAVPGETGISLSWTVPAGGYTGAYIIRKKGSAPANRSDGTLVCECTGTSKTDSPLNGGTYFYGAYSYDSAPAPGPNYSNGTTTSAWVFAKETVDSDKDFSSLGTSIALDSAGKPYIVFGGLQLNLGYLNGGDWTVQKIDSADYNVINPTIAIDHGDSNAIHLSYSKQTEYRLWYATNRTGKWTTTRVGTPQYAGTYSSLGVDSNHHVHIGYTANNYQQGYASNVTGEWVFSNFDSGTGSHTYIALAVDSHDAIHLSYGLSTEHNSQVLKYATNENGYLQTFTIDEPVSQRLGGSNSAIATGSQDKVHIIDSYRDNQYEPYYLRYLKQNGLAWEKTLLYNGGMGNPVASSLAVDRSDNDRVHIAFDCHDANFTICYINSNGSGWDSPMVVSNGANYWSSNSIAIDPAHNFHISYEKYQVEPSPYETYHLRYVTGNRSEWSEQILEHGSCHFNGSKGIALDRVEPGKVHLSYYDIKNGDVKYATNVSGNWVARTIDRDLGVWRDGATAIAVDSNNKAHISYYGNGSGLRYATNKSGVWVSQVLDPSPTAGFHNAIAIQKDDPLNQIHLAYYDQGNRLLYYKLHNGADWENAREIDEYYYDLVGGYPAIVIDSDQQFHISYFIKIENVIRYAHGNSSDWTLTTIDTSDLGADAGYTSIALSPSGSVYVSYYDAINNKLKMATNRSGSWQTDNTMDAATGVGKYTSIGVDSAGKVHIACYDETNFRLKFVSNVSGAWYAYTADSTANTGKYGALVIDDNDRIHFVYNARHPVYSYNSIIKYMTNANDSMQ